MVEIELAAPSGDVVALFEDHARLLGLQIHRGSLRKYPGGVHWHLTMPGMSGTLEANWWPKAGRLWLSVHGNRAALWQGEKIAALTQAFG